MESERQKEKKERPVSEKDTPFNIAEKKSAESAEARENDPYLMTLYNSFMPGLREYRPAKFVTDKYGNRIRAMVETKK